jgi:DNA-binding CsgD family transcriptional regulator
LLLLTSASEQRFEFADAYLSNTREVIRQIHRMTKNRVAGGCTPNDKALTKREMECLHWAVDGKTNWEISLILGVSKRTIIFHMQNVVVKLAAVNRQHAIAQAVSKGLVTPSPSSATRDTFSLDL